jgi:hypothetical protein
LGSGVWQRQQSSLSSGFQVLQFGQSILISSCKLRTLMVAQAGGCVKLFHRWDAISLDKRSVATTFPVSSRKRPKAFG